MVFILLMDRIKCCLNPLLQVLTVAPALHSLIVRHRKFVARNLKSLSHVCVYLRKLILETCYLGKDSTGLLANIVTLCPDLQGLSLEGCRPVTSAGYCLIAHLKKLSELNLSHTKVHYVYVKVLETHVCLCDRMKENRNAMFRCSVQVTEQVILPVEALTLEIQRHVYRLKSVILLCICHTVKRVQGEIYLSCINFSV
jgi:hypothetical protein